METADQRKAFPVTGLAKLNSGFCFAGGKTSSQIIPNVAKPHFFEYEHRPSRTCMAVNHYYR
jgi:hypothetical protein